MPGARLGRSGPLRCSSGLPARRSPGDAVGPHRDAQVGRSSGFQFPGSHAPHAAPTRPQCGRMPLGPRAIWRPGNLAICGAAIHAPQTARSPANGRAPRSNHGSERSGNFASAIRLDRPDQHGSDAASDGLVNFRSRTECRTLSRSQQSRATVPSTGPTAPGSSPCACPPCDCGNVHGGATRWNCSRECMLTADARPGQVLMHRNA